jgi:hypothetical protein
LRHFLLMITFAFAVSVVFGVTGRETPRAGFFYGLKIFAEFVAIGLVLSWLLYWLPLN